VQRRQQLQIVQFQLHQGQRNRLLNYLVFGVLTIVFVLAPVSLARLKRRRAALAASP
jgi:hypothetical protein